MVGLELKYFVLKPKGADGYACASRKAMRVYADVIESLNPLLSQQLIIWITKEEELVRLQSK